MLNFIYQIFLTINATSLIIVVFMIKEHTVIPFLSSYPSWVSSTIFIFIPIILTYISLIQTRYLSNDNVDGDIKEIYQANNTFLPSYLGYFFVALSVSDRETFIFVFTIIFIFAYFSQTLYFNPVFLLFKYHFYYITTENNVKIFLISKKQIRSTKVVSFPNLKRINNFTYIDVGKENESFNS